MLDFLNNYFKKIFRGFCHVAAKFNSRWHNLDSKQIFTFFGFLIIWQFFVSIYHEIMTLYITANVLSNAFFYVNKPFNKVIVAGGPIRKLFFCSAEWSSKQLFQQVIYTLKLLRRWDKQHITKRILVNFRLKRTDKFLPKIFLCM